MRQDCVILSIAFLSLFLPTSFVLITQKALAENPPNWGSEKWLERSFCKGSGGVGLVTVTGEKLVVII